MGIEEGGIRAGEEAYVNDETEKLLDVPEQDVAKEALRQIKDALEYMEGSDWLLTIPAQQIEGIVQVAMARLRMDGMKRDRRRPRWMAKLMGVSYPRWTEKVEPFLCFNVKLTEATKSASGRMVEVQVPADEAKFFAEQMLRMTETKGLTK